MLSFAILILAVLAMLPLHVTFVKRLHVLRPDLVSRWSLPPASEYITRRQVLLPYWRALLTRELHREVASSPQLRGLAEALFWLQLVLFVAFAVAVLEIAAAWLKPALGA